MGWWIDWFISINKLWINDSWIIFLPLGLLAWISKSMNKIRNVCIIEKKRTHFRYFFQKHQWVCVSYKLGNYCYIYKTENMKFLPSNGPNKWLSVAWYAPFLKRIEVKNWNQSKTAQDPVSWGLSVFRRIKNPVF